VKLGTPRWRTPFVLTGLLLLAGLIAPAALAAPSTATATIAASSPPAEAGATESYTFSLAPSNGQISSFNLTAPSGWSIDPLLSPPAGVTRPSATQIQGRGLSITASSPFSLSFRAQAACSPANATWSVVAKTGASFNGSSFSVTQPTTTLSGSCTAAFVPERGPAGAAFNNPNATKSENITSDAYSPNGAPMQVLVKDDGSSDPITIDEVGIGYQLDPTGSGVTSTLSSPFGIWEEGEDCGATCEVHGRSDDRNIDATVTADTPSSSSDLSVLVTELALNCGPSIPPGYDYTALSADVIAWRYTGDGSQTITVRVGRDLLLLDRGSAHIDVCYLAEPHPITGEPKTFTDKFGAGPTSGPGLLPNCDSTVVQNCILSQTAGPRGSRIVTFTVEDGRGKI
jgi:hypothetical protein